MEQQSFRAFLMAIEADDDAEAERQTHQLTSASEADLLALVSLKDVDRRSVDSQSVDLPSSDKLWWAARALACCGTERAVPILATLLNEEDCALRAVSALSLGHLYRRAPDAVSGVLDQVAALLIDDDGLVRQSAADALAICGDASIPVLQTVLQGSHEGARARAAYALRKIATTAITTARTAATAPLLFQHLNDQNYLVRTYAYEALDEMGLLDNVIVTL